MLYIFRLLGPLYAHVAGSHVYPNCSRSESRADMGSMELQAMPA